MRRTRGRRTLNLLSTVARHSVTRSGLTVQLQRVKTAKLLIHRKNRVHENCSPTFHLQLLFKDHRLIHHGSEVTSSQSWLDPTETGFMTTNFLSMKSVGEYDLWALFEHVLAIFMRWSY